MTALDPQFDIVLSTLNARYIHSSFGLRYLKANLNEWEDATSILEFGLDIRPEDAVEQLLSCDPKIVGFGVYIWNIEPTTRVVRLLRKLRPDLVVVIGGPEVSYEIENCEIVALADYVITGWGECSFYSLVNKLMSPPLVSLEPNTSTVKSHGKAEIIQGEQPPLDAIKMPYHLYTEEDVAHRLIYVEASRGCPYKCEFCLSALDKTAWPFDLDAFLEQMSLLYDRGVRQFKFVDRTFNLKIKSSLAILDFFLARIDDDLFLHFEVIPDHLPDALKAKIAEFPVGALQFEVGIQTFNPDVQQAISRRQKNDAAQENLIWMRQQSKAYIHADLIYGLPGEDIASFAASFNALYACQPHEIQVGILKRLKGSPIIRHTEEHGLIFNPNPPYNILQNNLCSFDEVQSMTRFARYWDLIANSGRFTATLPFFLTSSPFEEFMLISKALHRMTGQTHKISLLRLFDLLYQVGINEFEFSESELQAVLQQDFTRSGLKSVPRCLRESQGQTSSKSSSLTKRQNRHQS